MLKLFEMKRTPILKIREEKHEIDRHITQKTPRELFYENSNDYFGVDFPFGIDAKKLALKLKTANGKYKKI